METIQTTVTQTIKDTIANGGGNREIAKALVRMFFKDDDGKPFELSNGQADIFLTIFLKQFLRNEIITSTQYGKSETIAMAVILRSIVFAEKFTILAGDQNKTDIIMGKIITHLFDHPILERQIDTAGIPKLEKLKHQKSQDRITWRDGGEVRTLTADARNRKRVKEVLTGQGARNIIEDEASLIPDDLQAMAMRMLGGFKDGWILKIGNPFYNNHFKRSWKNKKYNRIFIDYKQAIAEGRYTADFIEEMRYEPFFDVLYECKFPDDSDYTAGGYRRLFSDKLIERAFITEEDFRNNYATKKVKDGDGNTIGRKPEGHTRLGGDIGGGGDRSGYVARWDKVAKPLEQNFIKDTMQQVPIVKRLRRDHMINDRDIALDYGGLGQGTSDRLHEVDIYVNKVMFGGTPDDKDLKKRYKNNRAYMYYLLYQWLKEGGKIVEWDGLRDELAVVMYKADSAGKVQIEPKDDLKKRLKEENKALTSPDIADALALTFADNTSLVDEDDFDWV